MSKCPRCGYHGPNREFKGFIKLWEFDPATNIRTGVNWGESKLLEIQAEFANGEHEGMEVVVAREGEFDHSGKLTKWPTDDVVVTSSHDWQRKADVRKNVLAWFGTHAEIKRRWS